MSYTLPECVKGLQILKLNGTTVSPRDSYFLANLDTKAGSKLEKALQEASDIHGVELTKTADNISVCTHPDKRRENFRHSHSLSKQG